MSSAVVGYKTTLGADAPPACYDDIEQAKCIFIAGANTAFAHPILFRRIEAAKKPIPDLKLIVVDPRRTDTAASADLHLAILPVNGRPRQVVALEDQPDLAVADPRQLEVVQALARRRSRSSR